MFFQRKNISLQQPKDNNMKRVLRRNHVILLVLFMLLACSMNMVAKDGVLYRGMPKDLVIEAIGKPSATSFDQNEEVWTYIKSSLSEKYDKVIIVTFDNSDKVVSYQEQLMPFGGMREHTKSLPSSSVNVPSPYRFPLSYRLNDKEFSLLYGKVKAVSFDDDKYVLLEVASIRCYYTCAQCAKLMKLFSFDDSKLKALRIMASHIVDPQNVYVITETMSFSDSKDRALKLLQTY